MPHKTNVELVVEMMEFSEFGAMAQVFIMEALDYYARTQIKGWEAGVRWNEDSIVNQEHWVGVAREVKSKLESRD